MKESLDQAKEELKRADHLIYVSLKYTRTVDVIKAIVERLINCLDHTIDMLLKHALEQKKISQIPTLPRLKAELCKKIYVDDQNVQNYIDFYHLLRKIDKARFERAQEYRRHVTMTAYLDDNAIEITIDIIHDYYQRTKEFVQYAEKFLEEEHE